MVKLNNRRIVTSTLLDLIGAKLERHAFLAKKRSVFSSFERRVKMKRNEKKHEKRNL
jgi:hypothetical protein